MQWGKWSDPHFLCICPRGWISRFCFTLFCFNLFRFWIWPESRSLFQDTRLLQHLFILSDLGPVPLRVHIAPEDADFLCPAFTLERIDGCRRLSLGSNRLPTMLAQQILQIFARDINRHTCICLRLGFLLLLLCLLLQQQLLLLLLLLAGSKRCPATCFLPSRRRYCCCFWGCCLCCCWSLWRCWGS